MRADTRIAAIIVAGTLMAAHPPPAFAQGVPVIDGSNLAQNIEQLQAALRDAENQLQQIEELRTQIERLTDIQGLLDDVLGSITGLNEIAALYNDGGPACPRPEDHRSIGFHGQPVTRGF